MYPYFDFDPRGSIIPLAAAELVSPYAQNLVNDTVVPAIKTICRENLLSIILRGSTACGCEIPGISDLDVVIIPKKSFETERSSIELLAGNLSQRYKKLFSLIDLSYKTTKDISTNNLLGMNIKLMGIPVYGSDIAKDILPMRCGVELASCIFHQTISETNECLKILDSDMSNYTYMGIRRDIKFLCIWVMRVLCRGLIAPVIANEQIFTLSVAASCNEFVRLFPAYSQTVRIFEKWERNPTADCKMLKSKVTSFLKKYQEVCNQCKINC